MNRDIMNTRAGKRAFIRALCRNVARDVCTAVADMPSEWDGHELRELLARAFADCRTRLMCENHKRRRAFENERLVRNLP